MSMIGGAWSAMSSMTQDGSIKDARLRRGTRRRVLGYAAPYRRLIVVLLSLTVVDALLVVATPLLLRQIVDQGVARRDTALVVWLAAGVAVLAVVGAALSVVLRWLSARVGEGLIHDLRRQVFGHVLRQPIAFFTRTQTGALVTRLNSDVIGAQQAFTSVLTNVVGNLLGVTVVLVTMAVLSWQLTLLALLVVPLVLLPARRMGRRLAALSRTQMQENAALGARMSERFDVAGALLVKLYGRPQQEEDEYGRRVAAVRDAGVSIAINRGAFMTALLLMASLATAVVYGVGGVLAARGSLTVGTLLALAALLGRLYTPLTVLSNVRVDVMTALVSFERVFEILDLEPLVAEPADPRPLPAGPLDVTLEEVTFAYPAADEVSLVSLETTGGGDRAAGEPVLRGIDLHVPAGAMTALVGPSGSGKTTLTGLISRLHDPTAGTVRVGGVDLREVASADLRSRVGVVSQDAHLFHDTIGANLRYARPEATDAELEQALRAAQAWELVSRLPQGLETTVGDRGHRLSGGEKQRLAIARMLLKDPDVVVLDEATAHLDSESEAAVQRALDQALQGRTSVVIAHRLSTVLGADQVVVLDRGQVAQRGTHAELLEHGGLYAELYRTQLRAGRSADDDGDDPASRTDAGEYQGPQGSSVP